MGTPAPIVKFQSTRPAWGATAGDLTPLLPVGYAELAANRALSSEKRWCRTEHFAVKVLSLEANSGVANLHGSERSLEVRADQPS